MRRTKLKKKSTQKISILKRKLWREEANSKYKNDPEYRKKKIERHKKYYFDHLETQREKARKRWADKRMKVLEFVGGVKGLVCNRCEFNDLRALQVDHVFGGGLAESRKFKDNKNYLIRIKENPQNYQLLCANCNWIKKYENQEHKKR